MEPIGIEGHSCQISMEYWWNWNRLGNCVSNSTASSVKSDGISQIDFFIPQEDPSAHPEEARYGFQDEH
jgi:hypothetical protein